MIDQNISSITLKISQTLPNNRERSLYEVKFNPTADNDLKAKQIKLLKRAANRQKRRSCYDPYLIDTQSPEPISKQGAHSYNTAIYDGNNIIPERVGDVKYHNNIDPRLLIAALLRDPQNDIKLLTIKEYSSRSNLSNFSIIEDNDFGIRFMADYYRDSDPTKTKVSAVFFIPDPSQCRSYPVYNWESYGLLPINDLHPIGYRYTTVNDQLRAVPMFAGVYGRFNGLWAFNEGTPRPIFAVNDKKYVTDLQVLTRSYGRRIEIDWFLLSSANHTHVLADKTELIDFHFPQNTIEFQEDSVSLDFSSSEMLQRSEDTIRAALNRIFGFNKDVIITASDEQATQLRTTYCPNDDIHQFTLGETEQHSIQCRLHIQRDSSTCDKNDYYIGNIKFAQVTLIYRSKTDSTSIALETTGNPAATYLINGKRMTIPLTKLFELSDKQLLSAEDYPFGEAPVSLDALISNKLRAAAFMQKLYELLPKYNNYIISNSRQPKSPNYKLIEIILYQPPLVPDSKIIELVANAVAHFNLSGRIPTLAFTGPTGVGKTTLAKKTAGLFSDSNGKQKGLRVCNASDLKGAYIGHTGRRTAQTLIEAYQNNCILLIDEAYTLMNDQFGEEAVSMLLPLMTGDRATIEWEELDPFNKPVKKSFEFTDGAPVIWFAGYDTELRSTLNQNQGLYRRINFILTMRAPTPSELYNGAVNYIKTNTSEMYTLNGEVTKYLLNAFELCKNDIVNFFSSAINNHFSRFFGNYAGMERFCQSCARMLDIDNADKDSITEYIHNVIDRELSELKQQYNAVLSGGGSTNSSGSRSIFEVCHNINCNFDQLAGYSSIKKELRSMIDMLAHKELCCDYGIRLPKGLLLAGSPGTGKTLLARAFAGELQFSFEQHGCDKKVAFIPVSASELIASGTDPISAIRNLFATAADYDCCVIFIDELDAIGKTREYNPYHSALLQLMKEMDGFEKRDSIFVLAATNAPESLDPALVRPGRMEKTISVELPEKSDRQALISLFFSRLKFLQEQPAEHISELTTRLAEKTSGFTPSSLENLINSAARLYFNIQRSDPDSIAEIYPHRFSGCQQQDKEAWFSQRTVLECFEADINETIDTLLMGEVNAAIKEPHFSLESNRGCSAVAIHEVGHAIVSIETGGKPFEKITIVPRGNALGYVINDLSQELRTKNDLLNRICISLGGYAAEEVFYGKDNVSIGTVQDLQQATALARKMVECFGMSDDIGRMALTISTSRYLGSNTAYTCSNDYRTIADKAVQDILNEQYKRALDILTLNRGKAQRMAEFVFINENVSGSIFVSELNKIA